MVHHACIIFWTLLPFLGGVIGEDKLLLVQIVHRHGDRSPISMFPKDEYQSDQWPRGLGQLTTTGIWRAYNLGRFLKKKYIDQKKFLPAMFNVKDVSIRSTGYDRTIMTADSLLTGMYPPDEAEAKWNPNVKDFPWQPIPVHSVPKKDDTLLRYGNNCPRYNQLKFGRFETLTPPLKQFLAVKSNTDTMDLAMEKSGAKGPYIMLYKLYDTLLIEQQNNLTQPAWVTEDVMNVLFNVTLLGNQLLTWTDEMKRLAGGNLLATILKNAEDKLKKMKVETNEADNNNQSAIIYSAHDSTVLALLGALDWNYSELPHYTAYIAVELYQGPTGPYLKFLYRNDGDIEPREPEELRLPACPDHAGCPLKNVLKYYNSTRHLMVRDYAKECSIGSEPVSGREEQLLQVVTGSLTNRTTFCDALPEAARQRQTWCSSLVTCHVEHLEQNDP